MTVLAPRIAVDNGESEGLFAAVRGKEGEEGLWGMDFVSFFCGKLGSSGLLNLGGFFGGEFGGSKGLRKGCRIFSERVIDVG